MTIRMVLQEDGRVALKDGNWRGIVEPHDSFTLAIAHKEDDKIILDCIRETRPPFSPEGVAAEFAATLRRYRVTSVTGDRYAGEWPREQFRKRHIEYRCADRPKSDLYLHLLPAINSGQVDLLDHDRLLAQLVGLERRTARSGRDSIDHQPNGHDDVANALAGAVYVVTSEAARIPDFFPGPLHGEIIRAPSVLASRNPLCKAHTSPNSGVKK